MVSISFVGKLLDGTQSIMPDESVVQLFSKAELTKHGQTRQKNLEHVQMEKYQQLIAEEYPHLIFDVISHDDRPDFFISRYDKVIGVDMAEFGFNSRRESARILERVEEQLLSVFQSGGLRKCSGLQFSIQLIDDWARKVPNGAAFINGVNQLADELGKFQVRPEHPSPIVFRSLDAHAASMHYFYSLPIPHCSGAQGIVESGGIKYFVNTLMQPPKTEFEKATNISINLLAGTDYHHASIRAALDRVIEKHDKPDQRIDELVIIAGGPDKNGRSLVQESTVATQFFTKFSGEISPPSNIQRVAVVDWHFNRIHLVYGFE